VVASGLVDHHLPPYNFGLIAAPNARPAKIWTKRTAIAMRIGAVNYLNSKPLVYGLEDQTAGCRLLFDLPSRLAESLAAGRLDVALIPSVEFFRTPGYAIVSDACVACRGPVRSVMLHFRVPPGDTKTIALDEGSRTSAALALILLQELAGVLPRRESLPIGAGLDETTADAILLIGDRAMQNTSQEFVEIWDLGSAWQDWAGLPFVFAMWVARPGVDTTALADILSGTRDRGVANLAAIAAKEGPSLGVEPGSALSYLRDNLHFTLGDDEIRALTRFQSMCADRNFVPRNVSPNWEQILVHGCSKS
jgi:chorismate dehydratase